MENSDAYPQKNIVIASVAGDFDLKVFYTTHHEFEIVVTKISTGEVKTSIKSATYEPVFGLDVSDHMMVMAEAEALCEAFEAESQ